MHLFLCRHHAPPVAPANCHHPCDDDKPKYNPDHQHRPPLQRLDKQIEHLPHRLHPHDHQSDLFVLSHDTNPPLLTQFFQCRDASRKVTPVRFPLLSAPHYFQVPNYFPTACSSLGVLVKGNAEAYDQYDEERGVEELDPGRHDKGEGGISDDEGEEGGWVQP